MIKAIYCMKEQSYDCYVNAQLSQRDRAAECVSIYKKWKTRTSRQYFTDISIFNHCDIIARQIYPIRWKNANTPFKVIQGHRGQYQSKALMRLSISD